MSTQAAKHSETPALRKSNSRDVWHRVKANKFAYFLILPGLVYFIIYKYLPMFGLAMAFQNYNPIKGFTGSQFVGLQNFQILFAYGDFAKAFRNTLIISFLKIGTGYFSTIFFALLLNELKSGWFKKTVQTITYAPHFLSWVTVYGIFSLLFNMQDGVLTRFAASMGLRIPDILGDPRIFRWTLVLSNIWKGIGWGTIVYLAGLSGVDPALYEAAMVDGATRFQRMIHVSIPALIPLLVIQLIMSFGSIMGENLDQILLFQNKLVMEVSDVFETVVYRQGLENMRYGYGAAVGMFQSVCGVILTLTANAIAKKVGQEGLW